MIAPPNPAETAAMPGPPVDSPPGFSGGGPWSVRMADAMLRRRPAARLRWRYEDGFLLRAIEQLWLSTGEARYWQAVADYAGRFVRPDGTIDTYDLAEYNLDQVMPGRLLFPALRATGEERFRKAILLLRDQLRGQPRTGCGGFWHKLIYPHQMWLDGIYMAGPFFAEYAGMFGEPAAYDDVVHQVITIEQHTRDPRTGLLRHGWDESRQQRWADPATGQSPHAWCRAMGWYVMGLVDVLDYLPASHAGVGPIAAILARALEALLAVRDPATGLWRQVLDQGDRPGNYLEASGACMYVYAMAKGVRTGRLPAPWLEPARLAFEQIVRRFVRVEARGEAHLRGTCAVAGLGGNPYRDGSFEYYISEKTVTDEPKGAAAFILAALEIEASDGAAGKG